MRRAALAIAAVFVATPAFASAPKPPARAATKGQKPVDPFTAMMHASVELAMAPMKMWAAAATGTEKAVKTAQRPNGPVDEPLIAQAVERVRAEYLSPGNKKTLRVSFPGAGWQRQGSLSTWQTSLPVTPNGRIRVHVEDVVTHVFKTVEVATRKGGTELAPGPSKPVTVWEPRIIDAAVVQVRNQAQFKEALGVTRDVGKPLGPNGEIPIRVIYPSGDPRGVLAVQVKTAGNGTRIAKRQDYERVGL